MMVTRMKRHFLPGLSLLFAVVLSSPACSFIFVTPPHEDYGGRVSGDCTTNRAAPIIDTIFTTTNVLSAVYVAGQDNVTNKSTAVGVGLGVAALWLSSAIYGYYNTSRCSELLEEDTPYSRPVPHSRRPVTTWQAPVRPAPSPAAAAPGQAGPADGAPPPVTGPGAPQNQDEEEPSQHPDPQPGPVRDPRFGH